MDPVEKRRAMKPVEAVLTIIALIFALGLLAVLPAFVIALYQVVLG